MNGVQEVVEFVVFGFIVSWVGTYLINMIRVPAMLYHEQGSIIAARTNEIASLKEARKEPQPTAQEQRQRESVRHTLADFSEQEKMVVRYILDHGEVHLDQIRGLELDDAIVQNALSKALIGSLILERVEAPQSNEFNHHVNAMSAMMSAAIFSTHWFRVNPSLETAMLFVLA